MFLDKFNKIDLEFLQRQTKEKKSDKTQTINIRNKPGAITTDPTDFKRLTRESFNPHALNNVHEMNQFSKRHKLPQSTSSEINTKKSALTMIKLNL